MIADIFVLVSVNLIFLESCLHPWLSLLSHGLNISLSCLSAFTPVCLALFENTLYTSVVKLGGGWGWTGGGVSLLYLGQWRHTPLSPCCAPAILLLSPFSAFSSVSSCNAMQAISFCTLTSWLWKTLNSIILVALVMTTIHPSNQASSEGIWQTFGCDTRLHNVGTLHNVGWGCRPVMWHLWHM